MMSTNTLTAKPQQAETARFLGLDVDDSAVLDEDQSEYILITCPVALN